MFWALFVVSVLMTLAIMATFVKVHAYRNMSSAKLVGLNFLMWCYMSVEWACFCWKFDFFRLQFLLFMDLANSIDNYFWGVINIVVFLQWAQVYRVISDP